MYVNTYIDTHTINLQSFNSLGHESFNRSSKIATKFGKAAPIGLPIWMLIFPMPSVGFIFEFVVD